MDEEVLISVVIPVFNERDNVAVIYESLAYHFDRLAIPFEIVFVDDGSRDDSRNAVLQLRNHDTRVKLVELSRNFGHQSAITAGMAFASGQALITMDADMQHPPDLVPRLIELWNEGYDVVYTVREETAGASHFKRGASSLFYWLLNRISDTPIVPGAADFRLLDRSVVEALEGMNERARFLRGMVSWVGFRQTSISFQAPPRLHGVSQYSFRKMVRLAMAGITNFSKAPLRLATWLGFLAALAGIPYALWAIYAKLFTDQTVPGWTSITVLLLFLGGVQLLCLGILGEYLGRVYDEVKQRPLYLVRSSHGIRTTSAEQPKLRLRRVC